MNHRKSNITIRLASPSDALELCRILNGIIHIGGTTSIESELTEEEFGKCFLNGENHVCCYVAVDESGALAGFQTLGHHPELPSNWVDIATFARTEPKVIGVGRALFAESKISARQSGFSAINATIRADNQGGLMYYDKMGFQTYSISEASSLSKDARIDSISKRFLLNDSIPAGSFLSNEI